MIGLAGAHRVGKSTTAQDVAERSDLTYITLPPIMKELGYRQDVDYSFSERLAIQEQILERAYDFWRDAPRPFICDRTPLDMFAYTVADALKTNVTHEDGLRLERYAGRCMRMTNLFFRTVVIIEPAIPFVPHPDKPPLNTAYQRHIATLVKGASVDPRLKVALTLLPVEMIDQTARANFVLECLKDTYRDILTEREGVLMN